MTISTEFSAWQDSGRSVDILAIDKNSNLVVIELKRDNVAAHAELQALRYAAMLSVCDFDALVQAGVSYQKKLGKDISEDEFGARLKSFLAIKSEEDVSDFGKIP